MVPGGLTIPRLLSFLNMYGITERKQKELKIYRKERFKGLGQI
jgi:hypothetical protein